MRWLLLVQQIDWIVITVSWPVCTTTQTKETTFPFSNKAHHHAILVMRLIITYCFFSSDWKFWGWHLDLYLKEKLFKYLKYNIKDRDIVRNPAIYNMLWIIEQNCPVVQATKLISALFYWKCSCNETRTIINASIWACCLFHLIRSWNGYNIHSSPAITEVLLFHKRLMKIYKLEKGLHLLLTSFFPDEHFYQIIKSAPFHRSIPKLYLQFSEPNWRTRLWQKRRLLMLIFSVRLSLSYLNFITLDG